MKKILPIMMTATCLWASVAIGAQTITFMHVENTKEVKQAFDTVIKGFESENPGITVEQKFIDNEAFKAKLSTLLHSKDSPNTFYTWGGGSYRELIQSGVLQDITNVDDSYNFFKKNLSPAALNAFVVNNKIYGVPYQVTEFGFWYNIDLFKKAGIDADKIKTWDDFQVACEKLKQAGITPLVVAGADKWTLDFYWMGLVIKLAGKEALDKAWMNNGPGFKDPVFLQASKMYVDFIKKGYFQNGFMTEHQNDGDGYFGDGKAAMILMGDWLESSQRNYAVDGKGVTNLGYFSFPSVVGGKGEHDVMGAINGWAVSKGAPEATAKWLQYLAGPKGQVVIAEVAGLIPAAKGLIDHVKNPYKKLIAQHIEDAAHVQIAFDQELGSDIGRVVNDMAADLASGNTTPEQGLETLQKAWDFR